jgi:putative nucleotidyltransferase with HDIG domain
MSVTKWQKDIMDLGELYRVGGSVRDELLRVPYGGEDVDYLVRGVPPDQLLEVLSRHGKVALVGRSFGVYKFQPADEDHDIDIAYPRKEVSTGPKHRDFRIKTNWQLPVEDDLGRRDFTINAIAQRVNDGQIIDPHGGREDIGSRRLRMIFVEAFEEDPLRILRGVRFATRFSLVIESETLDAMKGAAKLLDTLSGERLQDEFDKLFRQCDKPSAGLDCLWKLGALAVVLPELDRCVGVEQNEYHPDDVYWHSLKSCDEAPRDNLVVRWAALLHDLGKVDKKQTVEDKEAEGPGEKVVFYGHETVSAEMAGRILARLRYSTDFIRDCVALVANHMFFFSPDWNPATVRRFIRRVGAERLDDLFLLREADSRSRSRNQEIDRLEELRRRVEDELDAERAFRICDLAIDGSDVMSVLGLKEGVEVGRILKEIFELVTDEPSLNDREKLLDLLREQYR